MITIYFSISSYEFAKRFLVFRPLTIFRINNECQFKSLSLQQQQRLYLQIMAEQPIANKQGIRIFQQKIMNRSIMDLMCFQNLADYLLDCCSAQAKANTLSFFSLVPILISSLLVSGPTRLSFLITAISLLLHQILDIANKKQAYRLQSFSFGTYFFDHTCDTFSIILIVYIMGKLFQIANNWLLLLIFLLAILPFYIHHLTMYYNEYMCFPVISPATQGLLVLEILCLVGVALPGLFEVVVGGWVNVGHVVVGVALLWMIVFVLLDIRDIVKASGKFNEQFALKNLFVILVLGYVMFEMSVIQPSILTNSSLTFHLFLYSILLQFSLLIGQLLLKYASNEKFHQISGNTLTVTAYLTIIYSICTFINLDVDKQRTFGIVTASILAVGETLYFLYRNRIIMRFVGQAINQ